jgi:magnesium transporter
VQDGASGTALLPDSVAPPGRLRKKRNHRGSRSKRARRQSFAAVSDDRPGVPENTQTQGGMNIPPTTPSSFYRLQRNGSSSGSFESQELLDHR